ncbi:hypothetical protein Tsubulata_002558 [Turnera subulata]|uniref:J domain-containing protein n=1 Tax=Turnera subulata TaxID=218843 RepID=A0A9Q0GAC8_9ROSI|nr:hypothetical protein Tsubulata_002558 [Turnera subulata]
MRCYGLMIPGSESSRFYISPTTTKTLKPDSFLRVKPPARLPIGSLRAKATINDGRAATIAAATAEMSFYELLGIPESGTLPEIKQAYKQLARKYHPDVSPPGRVEEYTERFIRVQEAYETLSDPRRRALYDRDMAKGLHLAFSARRRYQSQNDVEMEAKTEWKNRWQSQLSELRRRSASKEASGNLSWAARMRQQREELSREV